MWNKTAKVVNVHVCAWDYGISFTIANFFLGTDWYVVLNDSKGSFQLIKFFAASQFIIPFSS